MDSLLFIFGVTVIAGLVLGMVLGLVYPLLRPGLLKREPRRRATALFVWAIAPGGLGLFIAGLLSVPSLMNVLGIAADHCHNHADRFPHICLSEPSILGSASYPWYLFASATALLAGFLARQGRHLQQHLRLQSALRLAERPQGLDYRLVPLHTPAAITMGYWKPPLSLRLPKNSMLSFSEDSCTT